MEQLGISSAEVGDTGPMNHGAVKLWEDYARRGRGEGGRRGEGSHFKLLSRIDSGMYA